MNRGADPNAAASPTAATIVKLGGSVITRKHQAERIRPKVLARLCREIVESEVATIVLHGAGSFGHPGAARFGLAAPPRASAAPRERLRGASIVAAEVRRLHLAVLRELVRAGGRPASTPMYGWAENDAGRCVRLDPSAVRTALDSGATAVSFGDVVPDLQWGSSILSADTIAASLARSLGIRRVLFVSDVPGILDPAERPRPTVVPRPTRALLERLSERTGGADVTGGIRGKLRTMLELADAGVEAGVISGLSDGRLLRALRGEAVLGSWTGPVSGAGS